MQQSWRLHYSEYHHSWSWIAVSVQFGTCQSKGWNRCSDFSKNWIRPVSSNILISSYRKFWMNGLVKKVSRTNFMENLLIWTHLPFPSMINGGDKWNIAWIPCLHITNLKEYPIWNNYISCIYWFAVYTSSWNSSLWIVSHEKHAYSTSQQWWVYQFKSKKKLKKVFLEGIDFYAALIPSLATVE